MLETTEAGGDAGALADKGGKNTVAIENGKRCAAAESSGTTWADKGGAKWASTGAVTDRGGTRWADEGGTTLADEGGTKCALTGAEAELGGRICAVAEPSGT